MHLHGKLSLNLSFDVLNTQVLSWLSQITKQMVWFLSLAGPTNVFYLRKWKRMRTCKSPKQNTNDDFNQLCTFHYRDFPGFIKHSMLLKLLWNVVTHVINTLEKNYACHWCGFTVFYERKQFYNLYNISSTYFICWDLPQNIPSLTVMLSVFGLRKGVDIYLKKKCLLILVEANDDRT